MKFSLILPVVAGLFSASQAITVSYDRGYDDAGRSLTAVACSDGANGLITRKGWQTQGQIPVFPYIGGWEGIPGWNSPNCGTCHEISFEGRTIKVLAIDHSAGFNLAFAAMNALTGGQAEQRGRIEASSRQLSPGECGM